MERETSSRYNELAPVLKATRYPELEEIGIPYQETETRNIGSITMVTTGLGYLETNQDLAEQLPQSLLVEKGILRDGVLRPEVITKLTGFESRTQLYRLGISIEQSLDIVHAGAKSVARQALKQAKWQSQDVDVLVTLGSYTRNNYGFDILSSLNAKNAALLEVICACPAPAIALNMLSQLHQQENRNLRVLITGAEVFSHIKEEDRLLFADRMLAITLTLGEDISILSPLVWGETVREYPAESKYLSVASPHYSLEGFTTKGGVIHQKQVNINGQNHTQLRSSHSDEYINDPENIRLVMIGDQVARWMATETHKPVDSALAYTGLQYSDIKMIVPHGANGRFVRMLRRMFSRETGLDSSEIPPIYFATEDVGNCSSLTTLLALTRALDGYHLDPDNKPSSGDKLVLVSMGGGLGTAASVVKIL